MEKNVLVIGANGLLGTVFRTFVGEKYTYAVRNYADEKFPTDIAIGDISELSIERDAELFANFDIVINCAAVTDVDGIENDWKIRENAIKSNFKGVARLAEICKHNNSTLIHISSDYVFDGRLGREYFPTDVRKPINQYGETKLMGENAILNSGCKHIIIRASWLYSPYTPNFVTKMIDNAMNNQCLVGTNNVISSPTSAIELVKAIEHIIDSNLDYNVGIYHFTDAGCCTKYDIMSFIYDKIKNEGLIKAMPDSYWESNTQRPFCSILSKENFINTFKYSPWSWMKNIGECIDEYKKLRDENNNN